MKYGKASLAGLLALSLSNPFSAQQQPESQSETTLSTTTELVLVPAQVKGKDGKPLLGLKAEDFVLRSDGKPQPIRVFEETGQDTAAPRITNSPAAIADTVFNVPDGGMPDRILIIALDLVNTPAADQARARRDLLKYLQEQQATHQHFALVTITRNGLSQIHNFSSDPAVLVEALKKIETTQ